MMYKKILKNQNFRTASKRFNKISKGFKPFWQKHQLKAVAVVTVVFLLALAATQFTKAQPEEEIVERTTRKVETLSINTSQVSQTVPATVKNLNSVTLVAQTAGPIGSINYREGSNVYQGTLIASQNSSYSGGNSAVVGSQIAGKNFELAEETLKNTVEIVSKNRELADLNRNNTEELRKISEQSVGETEEVLNLIHDRIEATETQLADPTISPETQSQLAQQLISLKSSANQTEQGLRNLRYQLDTDKPADKLAEASKDLVYKTTELQLKSAEISKDIASLSYKQAQIAASMTRVVAPFAGTVEKIYVEPGQYVTPGTPVAKITGAPRLCIVATISGNLATKIDNASSLTFEVNGKSYTQPINHVTSTPTSGSLYEVLTTLPEWYSNILYENQTIEITLPLLGSALTTTEFIPVDAVFVTNTSRFVYVLEDGKAVRRVVDTGAIVGSNIEIKSGLTNTDTIILDRSVDEHDLVEGV